MMGDCKKVAVKQYNLNKLKKAFKKDLMILKKIK